MSESIRALSPECPPLDYISYSDWSKLATCLLKSAFSRDPRTRTWDRGSTWSALGNARHHLVEEVAALKRTGLASPSSSWVRSRFDKLLDWQRDQLVTEWDTTLIPPIRRWPDVVYTRARLASDLGDGDGDGWPAADQTVSAVIPKTGTAMHHTPGPPRPSDGDALVEGWFQDDDRQLRGRIDRIDNRNGQLAVVDLKSGVGATDDELAARHREQMLLYAGLVQSAYGAWPLLELQPVAGQAVPVAYQPSDVVHVQARVDADRAAFNTALSTASLVSGANPSQSVCAWCPFQVVCPALIGALAGESHNFVDPPSRDVSLAAGKVDEVHRFTAATDVVINQTVGLTAPPGKVMVTRLDPELEVSRGDHITVSGLQAAGGSHVMRAQWDSRVRIEPA